MKKDPTEAPRDEGFEAFKRLVREIATKPHPLPKDVVATLRKPRTRS